MTKLTKALGLYGISSLAIRFIWIQIFRFSLVHEIKNSSSGWDVNGIWVGGPLGWQHFLLELFWYSGLIALVVAICLFCRNLHSHARGRTA